MPIDIASIDAKIKKLRELKRIASDPEMLQLLEGFVTANGNKPEAAEASRLNAVPRKGEQKNAALSAVSGMTGRFTASDIVDVMKEAGFTFAAHSPTIAVNGVLRRLVKSGGLTIAVKGSGRAGHQYERV